MAAFGGPELWREIPFSSEKNYWAITCRENIPPEYAFDDWWSEESLKAEAAIAREYMLPWQLRGPPHGPQPGTPLLWRGMEWRPNTRKWMKRAGSQLDERNLAYGKASKSKKGGATKGMGKK